MGRLYFWYAVQVGEDVKEIYDLIKDTENRRTRSRRRHFWAAMFTFLPFFGGAFAWSYDTIAKDLKARSTETKLVQTNKVAIDKAIEQLNSLTSDFNIYRSEQTIEENAWKFQRYRIEVMLEQITLELGKTPPKKSKPHQDAEEMIGIVPEDQ